ncbi:hypothetical protein B9Z55_000485 [Caenorhabditis nigoni]|uniref:Uncharacterized protein n=1 Tax=Caenorhabditis nigoni TaxID=1611254 RepID=A0A2G5VTM6_9PELO|nr:hypothetical protein B9Z55_000485 [Caenorhabditis nigoni]
MCGPNFFYIFLNIFYSCSSMDQCADLNIFIFLIHSPFILHGTKSKRNKTHPAAKTPNFLGENGNESIQMHGLQLFYLCERFPHVKSCNKVSS